MKQNKGESIKRINEMDYSHDLLVTRASKWLRNTANCGAVITETFAASSTGETPDAIGFRSSGVSILIECKASRADFLADAKKPFRKRPEIGMGLYRFYMCPEDMIDVGELPDKWGLLYMGMRKTVKIVAGGPKGNMWLGHQDECFHERNHQAEWDLLYSSLRRAQSNNR